MRQQHLELVRMNNPRTQLFGFGRFAAEELTVAHQNRGLPGNPSHYTNTELLRTLLKLSPLRLVTASEHHLGPDTQRFTQVPALR